MTIIFPTVKLSTNGTGFPANSLTNFTVDCAENMYPMTIHTEKPIRRSRNVIDGHMESLSSVSDDPNIHDAAVLLSFTLVLPLFSNGSKLFIVAILISNIDLSPINQVFEYS